MREQGCFWSNRTDRITLKFEHALFEGPNWPIQWISFLLVQLSIRSVRGHMAASTAAFRGGRPSLDPCCDNCRWTTHSWDLTAFRTRRCFTIVLSGHQTECGTWYALPGYRNLSIFHVTPRSCFFSAAANSPRYNVASHELILFYPRINIPRFAVWSYLSGNEQKGNACPRDGEGGLGGIEMHCGVIKRILSG